MTKLNELDLKVTKINPVRAETGSCFDATIFSKIKVSNAGARKPLLRFWVGIAFDITNRKKIRFHCKQTSLIGASRWSRSAPKETDRCVRIFVQ